MRKKKNQGQASVMIGIITLTFLLFFTFVVNVGMLVNAKINLQNAADLAAYAGAAVQARQLTQISHLNYEMRRQYKKFLFRYYILGNMAQASQPKQASATGARKWSPDNAADYRVPSVCMIWNGRDNYCQLSKLPAIAAPGSTVVDSINQALEKQILEIARIQKGNCRSIGYMNLQLLLTWLFNTDPSLDTLQSLLGGLGGDAKAQERINVFRHVAKGMGLIPRELLLRMRIDTLNKYVNAPAARGVTRGAVAALASSPNVPKYERTIQAYFSAYNSLGNHTFDDEEAIVMDELLPSGTDGSQLLSLKDIKTNFDAYAINLARNPNGPGQPPPSNACEQDLNPNDPASTNPQDCVACPTPFNIQAPDGAVVVGVQKDPSILTYYAVRLTANAKVMFSPFGDVTLRAYSAAQPFGSRVGPPLTAADWIRAGGYNPTFCEPIASAGGGNCVQAVPNLPVKAGEGTGTGQGWDNQQLQAALFLNLVPSNDTSVSTQIINELAVDRATHSAMAPNPAERGKYNIPANDSVAELTYVPDDFVRNFNSDGAYAIWAPILESSNASANLENEIREQIDRTLPRGEAGASIFNQIKEPLIQGVSAYVEKLRRGEGEDGEGFHVVRIQDPLNHKLPNREPVKLPQELLLGADSDPKQIKTSWNGVRDAAHEQKGRSGYSVKFVSFSHLAGPGQDVSNTRSLASELGDDLPFVKH